MGIVVLVFSLIIELFAVGVSASKSERENEKSKKNADTYNKRLAKFKSKLVISDEELYYFNERMYKDKDFNDRVLNYYYIIIDKLGVNQEFYKSQEIAQILSDEIFLVGHYRILNDTVDSMYGEPLRCSAKLFAYENPDEPWRKINHDDLKIFYKWMSDKINSRFEEYYIVKYADSFEHKHYGWNVVPRGHDRIIKRL